MTFKIQFSFPFPEFSQGPNMELIKTNSNIKMDEKSLKENNKKWKLTERHNICRPVNIEETYLLACKTM